MKGAPIRFVAGVLGVWTCARIALLLPGEKALDIAADVLAPPAAAAGRAEVRAVAPPAAAPALVRAPMRSAAAVRGAASTRSPGAAPYPAQGERPDTSTPAHLAVIREDQPPSPILMPPTLGGEPEPTTPDRLGISAWLLARGGANGTLSGGMLGASQAGVRATYAIDTRRRIALSARVAAPLRGRGAEAAVGIDWQPTRAPVHLLAEQRFGLDGARGGPTVMAIAGLNPMSIAAGFRLEAYAQGGAIWRGGRAEAFGDGAARLTRPPASVGDLVLDAGAGAWAAGQRGATRVDLGPTVGVALPLAGRRVRVSADWRQRIAGDARPGSGPALSIGTDF